MDGILLIDKPKGWTSFDVVAKVRGALQSEIRLDSRVRAPQQAGTIRSSKVKVGHTGTLDPLATGLLILVIGSYCKRAQEFSKLDKIYETEVTIGHTSTTDDGEGVKTKNGDKIPSTEEVIELLHTFVGKQMQMPPSFSAIKVGGKRAYKLAREGKPVVIEPREVEVFSISDITYSYPTIRFTIHVSSGTYIRSIARDLGERLGTGAYMSELRRTKVSSFEVDQALSIDSWTSTDIRLLL